MRSLISALFFMLALSACDNELNLISRDFSVSLKSIDGGAAAVGKAVNCTFSVNGLDPDNGDQLLTMFEIEGGNGVIIVDNSEYSLVSLLNMIIRQKANSLLILSRQRQEL